MKYKKTVTFVVEENIETITNEILEKYSNVNLYKIGEIKAFETIEEASDALIRECTDGDYDEWSWSTASEVLKQIFFTMSKEDAEVAVEMAYDNAKRGYSREHVFHIITSWYDDYAYDNMLKRVLYKALVDSNLEILMSAVDTAMELYPGEFRTSIEAIKYPDNSLVGRFLKQVLNRE